MNDSEATRATKRAVAEGRVHGRYRCPRCGMRSHIRSEAAKCCQGLGPHSLERVSEARYDRLE